MWKKSAVPSRRRVCVNDVVNAFPMTTSLFHIVAFRRCMKTFIETENGEIFSHNTRRHDGARAVRSARERA